MISGYSSLVADQKENVQSNQLAFLNPVKEVSSAALILLTFKPSVEYAKALESFKTEKKFANLLVLDFDTAMQSLREKCLADKFNYHSTKTETSQWPTSNRFKRLAIKLETTIGPMRFLPHVSKNRDKYTYIKVAKLKEFSLTRQLRIIAKELGKVLSVF